MGRYDMVRESRKRRRISSFRSSEFPTALPNNFVLRGGWALYRALGFELGATSTWDTTTVNSTSLDNGLTPNPTFDTGTPFPDGYIPLPGDSQGLASGDGIWEDSWYRLIPYIHQFSFGLQGGLRGGIVWDVEYVGARTFDLRAGSSVTT